MNRDTKATAGDWLSVPVVLAFILSADSLMAKFGPLGFVAAGGLTFALVCLIQRLGAERDG